LRAAGPGAVFDVVDLLSPDGVKRLRAYANRGFTGAPRPGFWADDRSVAPRRSAG
jgi:hypothetical protein